MYFGQSQISSYVKYSIRFFARSRGNWNCRFYYPHENFTLLYQSNFEAIEEELSKIKNLISNSDVFQSCTREWANTKCKFYQLTKNTLFAALLKEVLGECEYAVLPDPLLKNHRVKILKV